MSGDEEVNGTDKQIPAIIVGWDGEENRVHLQFDGAKFKNLEFVSAVLGIAKEQIDTQRRMMLADQMKQKQQQAQMEAKALRGLRLG